MSQSRARVRAVCHSFEAKHTASPVPSLPCCCLRARSHGWVVDSPLCLRCLCDLACATLPDLIRKLERKIGPLKVILAKLLDNSSASAASALPQPSNLTPSLTMADHQRIGLTWLHTLHAHGHSGILADEMGLGKTAQIVATISQLSSRHHVTGPFLIVAPLSTIGHWARELRTPSSPYLPW